MVVQRLNRSFASSLEVGPQPSGRFFTRTVNGCGPSASRKLACALHEYPQRDVPVQEPRFHSGK